jgi:hypothetical protein
MPSTDIEWQSNAQARFSLDQHRTSLSLTCSLIEFSRARSLSETFPALTFPVFTFSASHVSHTNCFPTFFPFFLLSENFPSSHEKHFPNDWFSLRLNLHDARRVLLFGSPGHCSVSPQNAEKEFISDREMNKFSLKKSVKTDKKD